MQSRGVRPTFNVTNGDLLRWSSLWPKIAQFFGLGVGPQRHVNLEQFMADKKTIKGRR